MLCLLAGTALVPLMSGAITLAWMHSVEKIPWEEDWRADGDRLVLVETRVRGSGAGMEPAADARLVNGAWTWNPHVPPLELVVLRRSGATADWRVCLAGSCREMGAYVGPHADPVILKVCSTDVSGGPTARSHEPAATDRP